MSPDFRSLDVAYARIGSVLTRVLAVRWRSPKAVTFANQRWLLDLEGLR